MWMRWPAMGEPLVSIVTPTIVGRESDLFNRCVPSVMHQTWLGPIEHVIVSDRNEKEFDSCHNYRIGDYRMRSVQINESWRTPQAEASIGAVPFAVGSLLALGEFVGFCGDDDQLYPDHVRRHVEAMRQAEAMFSISAVDFWINGEHWCNVGPGYEHGHVDAIGIMCHVDALKVATWTANGENAADHRLVRDWRAAGLRGVLVDGPPTAIHHDGWPVGRSGRPDRPGGGY